MLATKYQKLEPRCHVLQRPGMYVGSVESERASVFVYDVERGAMEKREIDYVPGLYKIFDEIVTNAIDHATRLQQLAAAGPSPAAAGVNRVRNVRVDIDAETGRIEVFNDGDGIDVAQHPEHGLWIPEMIFGHMLTSANYDDDSGEERVVGGQNGLGAKCCNIFSRTFELETVDAVRHKVYTQTFSDNMAEKSAPVIRACRKKPYTRIRFLPDYERFGLPGRLTPDMAALFAKRVTDACALTAADVAVYLNGARLEAKTFERYADMYLGARGARPRVYERVGERFEVVATYHDGPPGLEHVSFVNGVWTLRGGRHVDYVAAQVSKRLCELLQQRRKMEHLKPQHVKDRLMLFIKCVIPNAAFDSQSKETMTTPVGKWGSKPELSDGFFDKLCKTGIAELLQEASDDAASKALKQTDGRKKSVLRGIPKLHDAADAGGKKSAQCSLILTEGDSALAMAISGRSVVGSAKWGAMPLKGKLINVRDASCKKIADNEELSVLKKILGLESGREYADTADLRYGRIVIMSDQDPDGAHIRALVCNWIACQWPSLLAQPGFVTTLLTPIVKAYRANEVREFYCLPDYERWKRDTDTKGWRIKYYKGLATSTSAEAKEYFKKMRLVEYRREDAADDEALDLAFNRKRADERKAWLEAYDESRVLDYDRPEVSYRELVHRDLIHFSQYDLERSIPSMVDGLKVSQRKVLYACFAGNLVRGEVRVSTLASDTTARAHYNHGEASLQGAIVGMAQDFVGSNNVNLLQPNGQFGCLDPLTEVLRWDGSIALAKDIVAGDLLVGDDGAPRQVLRTTAGTDTMYRVSMVNGDSYVVNSQHILTLRRNDTRVVEDIKLTDYLALPAAVRGNYSGVKNTTSIGWTHEERKRITAAWSDRPGMMRGAAGMLMTTTSAFPVRVDKLGHGPFCGWQVDGNERFLLADFTVTHNSRLQGGKDAGSPRYIHTLLAPATPRLFPRADEAVLDWREDDGHRVEPRHYAPVLPMVLVNGALGIGTGFSTSVPCYDPRVLLSAVRRLLSGECAPEELPEPVPWYRGFKGRVEETAPGKYVTVGTYERVSPTKLRITELPVGTWTEDYKMFLEELCERCADVRSIDHEYTDETARFAVTFANEGALTSRLASPAALEAEFKLVSRPITTSNMYLYNERGQIRKYASARDIIAAHYAVRLDYYGKRREALLAEMEAESVTVGAKVRFIQSVIDDEVRLFDVDKDAVTARLRELGFPGDADEDYDFLLRMPMSSVTAERKKALQDEHARLRERIERLRSSTPASMWLEELDALALPE